MPSDMSVWQGRSDPEDGDQGLRWHQLIQPAEDANDEGIMILGFACDEGVARNKGRIGAYDAPISIKRALANLAWHHNKPIYDGGDIRCDDGNLSLAQYRLSEDVCQSLRQRHRLIVLGGGHEVAWGTFQGIGNYLLQKQQPEPLTAQEYTCHPPTVGIINFDAHFDLRNPPVQTQVEQGSSGTPFHQIARFCELQNWPFHYACLGISRASNTQALFSKADQLGVLYVEDNELNASDIAAVSEKLSLFIQQSDYLYLTIDMDVFPASAAPGVSAPATYGVPPTVVDQLLHIVLDAKSQSGESKILVADIAEYNPRFDIDGQTARLAARLVWTIARAFSR
ncbi:formimidoylglutamase [Photobacterium aquae]|uniref:Formimidoylglutamase n=1 Tax=Photobacterium aquae TaxID=1195763 RepID=A0A0J1GUR6_9GAMM|nr:formimidoylglutamase [Photobacterium aquae]KLV03463.1 formimidoylglutamase [Photobacterium aquae]